MSATPLPVPAPPLPTSAGSPPGMSWSGWGDAVRKPPMPATGQAFLARRIGLKPGFTPAVALGAVSVNPSALPVAAEALLTQAVGAQHVRTDHETRVSRSGGKSYPDLVRRRTGDALLAPDAVVFPANADEVAAVLRICSAEGVAVVPFGGGTSVVGGVEPLRGQFAAIIALDLSRLDALLAVDSVSLTATLQPGLRGPQAEALLNAHGLTLGHFPQSYEHASIGGYVATRSAGQASSGYGRIDEMVTGVRMATPVGEMVLGRGTKNAAGPDLLHLVVGSEGAFGVITEVTLRVARKPEVKRHEGWFFRSFAEGAEAMRTLEQAGVAPDISRLSDEHETAASLALAGLAGAKALGVQAFQKVRGVENGALAIFGWEGSSDSDISHRRVAAARVLKDAGGAYAGRLFGRTWEHGRYGGPYLRDTLLDHGVMVETLETATTWSRLGELHLAVRAALESALAARGTPALVLCHISHLYTTGASLYFTFLARREEDALVEQWRAAKTAACEALVAHGATITHHHAVGTDHRPYLSAEIGELGVAALRAVKRQLDPAGVLNPGKLIPQRAE